jgi:hypothetical protein
MVVTLRICVLFAQQERARKQDQHADGDGGVRKVENEERPPFAEVKIGGNRPRNRGAPGL